MELIYRYNTFFVLYPLGVASECWLIYRAIPPASKMNELYGYGLWAVLATYLPGFYTLFTHMLRQRSKVMKAERADKRKKAL
jgi:very-long-chain (3R)-3-hydroxyacyl-CoA dehydratase